MLEIPDILGNYFLQITEEGLPFSNTYALSIEYAKHQLLFTLEMSTHCKTGTFGQTWVGKALWRSDHFALIIFQQTDWVTHHLDNTKTSFTKNINKPLPVEIYPQSDSLVLYHKFVDRFVVIPKVNK